MARAKRHYIPGQVWHITHRCHKGDYLLKLKMDRRRWGQWLYEAKKRYGLVILNYNVTSNHVHLLVQDVEGDRNVIPQSIKLVAGRTGQKYNLRKNRKGAFWEDRYHATAIESDQHLLKCLVYIDLNMVRAGVVDHPSEWLFSGYNEIQRPKRKCVLIAYQKLVELTGFETYDVFREFHRELVDESLVNGSNYRQGIWSDSVAVGGKNYVETIKRKLGLRSKGRKIIESDEGFQLREGAGAYIADFNCENVNIGQETLSLHGTNDVKTAS